MINIEEGESKSDKNNNNGDDDDEKNNRKEGLFCCCKENTKPIESKENEKANDSHGNNTNEQKDDGDEDAFNRDNAMKEKDGVNEPNSNANINEHESTYNKK